MKSLVVTYVACMQVQELRSNGCEPYAYQWDRTHTANQLQEIYKNLGNGEESNTESDHVSVAGRIVARRAFGKLAFLTLRDDSGTIQVCNAIRIWFTALVYLIHLVAFFALSISFNMSTFGDI